MVSKITMAVPVEISARHLHLSQKDLIKLFGKNYRLTKIKVLSQPGEFSAKETVELIGPKASLKKVRVVGPLRPQTQVEITATDGRLLGIKAPVRVSGDVKKSAGASLKGPRGTVKLKAGVIIAQRHLHLSLKEAKEFGLKDRQKVSVKIAGPRGLTFDNVVVRSGPLYKKACHLDTDEANAAGLASCGRGLVIWHC